MSTDYSSPVGPMNIEGLISGLDISNILDQLAAIRRRPIEVLEARRQQLQDRLSLYQSLETYVLSLQTAAQTLADDDTFRARSVSSSDATAVSVSADPGAPLGSHSIVVNQLAQVHKLQSASFTATNEALGLQGDIIVNGHTVHISADDDLLNIAAAINAANAGVQAAIVHIAENDHRLILTGLQTGDENAIDLVDANADSVLVSLGLVQSTTAIKHEITNGAASDLITSSTSAVGDVLQLQSAPSGTVQINGTDVAIDLGVDSLQDIADRITSTVSDVTATVATLDTDDGVRYELRIVGDSGTPTFSDASNVLCTLGILTKAPANELQAAQDAEIVFDGQTVTRSTNSIDDLIDGLHLELLQANPSATITLTINGDLEPAVQAVQNLVEQYNRVMEFVHEHQQYDPETNTGGELIANYDIVRMEGDLRAAVTYPVQGLTSDTILLSQIGITTDQSDRLVLDETELRSALNTDPLAVQRLFTVTAETTSSYVQYISSTADTQPSESSGYAVSITQVATRARAESSSLPSGIAVTETLTFCGEHQVTLTAGMTLQEASDALNSMFEENGLGLVASVSGTRLVIEHELYGSDYDIAISSTLDQGAGGTDLGGPSAGDEQVYAGTDVAGTIGGEPATGEGQYLTGDDTNEHTAGLRLRITATAPGDCGVVHFAKGAGRRLLDVISGLEDAEYGTFARITDSINDQIERIDQDISTLQARLDTYIDEMRRKFIAMEQALAEAQALSEYIANQLTVITSLFGRSVRTTP